MKIKRKYSNGGCMKSGMQLTAVIIIVIWLLVTIWGCSKQEIETSQQVTCNTYTMEIAYYTLDTLPYVMPSGLAKGKSTYTWDRWEKVCDPVLKNTFETSKDVWGQICPATESSFLQQVYYTRNGKKIFETKYPINK